MPASTMMLASGYDRSKNPAKSPYHFATWEEVQALPSHVQWLDVNNKVRNAKVNSVKTWKRRPKDKLIRLKYGMYEYFDIEYRNGERVSMDGIVIPDPPNNE